MFTLSPHDRRWLLFLPVAVALHAAAMFGVGVRSPNPEPLAIGAEPIELSFAAPAEPAAVSQPAVAAAAPAVTQPDPEPEPELKPTRKQPLPRDPEPEPEPAPAPEALPQAPDPAPQSETPAATDLAQNVLPLPAPTRFNGKPAHDARSYFGQISAWIDANKDYPVECKKQKQQGTVVVKFSIGRNGALLASSLKSSSGHALLDEAALATLARAAPFPSIPDFIGRETLTIAVPIDYTLITE